MRTHRVPHRGRRLLEVAQILPAITHRIPSMPLRLTTRNPAEAVILITIRKSSVALRARRSATASRPQEGFVLNNRKDFRIIQRILFHQMQSIIILRSQANQVIPEQAQSVRTKQSTASRSSARSVSCSPRCLCAARCAIAPPPRLPSVDRRFQAAGILG